VRSRSLEPALRIVFLAVFARLVYLKMVMLVSHVTNVLAILMLLPPLLHHLSLLLNLLPLLQLLQPLLLVLRQHRKKKTAAQYDVLHLIALKINGLHLRINVVPNVNLLVLWVNFLSLILIAEHRHALADRHV